jgi:hypothetical protein
MILYKYCPVDRVSVLRDRRIFFTKPAVLNDPFEETPLPEDDGSVAQGVGGVGWFTTLLKEAAARDPGRPFTLAVDSLVVLSLSSRADSLLMWSHYADWHAGFVIALDTDHPSLAGGRFRHLAQVRYLHDRPTAPLERQVITDELMLTKSVEWHYEAEWRMIDSCWDACGGPLEVSPHSWPFPLDPAAVREVIIGCRSRQELVDDLAEALDTPAYAHVSVRRTAIDLAKYRLNVSEPTPQPRGRSGGA